MYLLTNKPACKGQYLKVPLFRSIRRSISTQVVQRLQHPSNSKTYLLWGDKEANLDMIPGIIPGRYPNNIKFSKIFPPRNGKKSPLVLISIGSAYYYE